MSTRFVPFLAMLVIVVGGCGTARNVAWPEPRPLAEEFPTYKPPIDPEASNSTTDDVAGDTLALNEALRLALQQNPELREAGWEVRAREAATLQAGLWPNPEIGADIEEFGGTGPLAALSAAEIGGGIGQLLPFGGDVGARRDVAARERDLAGWTYEAARLDVATYTMQTFVDVLAAQRRLALADSLLQIADRFLETVASRAEAGKVSPLEVERAGIVRSNVVIERREAVADLEAARKQLGAAWGETTPTFERVVGSLAEVGPIPAYESVRSLVERNPDVARWSTEITLRRADLSLARANRIPDPIFTAGPSRFQETGETAFRAGISIPLPIFDRNQGAIQESKYRIRQAESGASSARVEAESRLASAYETLAAALDRIDILRTSVLPAARRSFEGIEEGYREGKFDLLSVLDAQRTLFESTNNYVEALATYHQARAEVERLIGTPLSEILIE
ncbi:MAG: TolC family protein [Rhodothermales bacterium]